MSEDINNKLGEIRTAFEEFKRANDTRLDAIESKGSADVLDTDKVNRINTAITELQNEVKAMQRPAAADAAVMEDMEYRNAYANFVMKGELSPELKAMTVGSNADGGYAVPTILDSAISTKLKMVSPMRQLAKVISVASPNFSHLVNAHNTGMSGWVGETAARPQTNTPQFISVPVNNGEVYANAAISQFLIDGDAVVNMENLVSDELALEFAKAEGAAFISGDGTNKPSGFLNNTPTATGDDANLQYTAGGAAAALNSADAIIKLFYSLASPYRRNAKFVATSATQAAIRLLKDSTGNYLWGLGLNGSPVPTIMGQEVVECPDMPEIAANSFPLAFGDFNAGYVIIDRRQTITLRDPYTAKPYVLLYAAKRVGGKLVLPEAIKVLKVATA